MRKTVVVILAVIVPRIGFTDWEPGVGSFQLGSQKRIANNQAMIFHFPLPIASLPSTVKKAVAPKGRKRCKNGKERIFSFWGDGSVIVRQSHCVFHERSDSCKLQNS